MADRWTLPAVMRRRPATSSAVLTLLALAVLVVLMRAWITTDAGRDFIVSQIDGRDVAGYGQLSVRRLEGDPLSELSIGSIEIRDASGVWFSAESVQLTWSPAKLLSRTVKLDDLKVSRIEVLRRPTRTERPGPGRRSWEVRLGNAAVDRLHLAEGVAGPESASALTARFVNERSGAIDALLKITPLDGAGDQIEARIIRDRESAFDLKIDGTAPAGGVFAHLLQLPDGASAIVRATAAGNLDDGRGEARLTVEGSDKVFLSGKIENNVLDASLRMDAGALPVPESFAAFLGSKAEADTTVTFEKDAVAFSVVSRIAAGTVDISGRSRADRLELLEPARLKARLTTLAPFWDAADTLDLEGTLAKRDAGYQFEGDTRLTLEESSSLPFGAVSGPVTVSLESGRIPFTTNIVTEKAFTGNARARSILGEEIRFSGSGLYDLGSRRLLLDAVEVTHRSGKAQLLGEAGFADRRINISGRITQSIAALPGGFGGTAAGFVQAKGQLKDFELGLNLNLENTTTSFGDLKPLIEGRGTLRGVLQIQPDTGDIRRAEFRLPGLEGQIKGRLYGARSPDLQFSLQQLISLEVAGSQVDLNAVTGRIQPEAGGLMLTAASDGGSALVSGRNVSGLAAQADVLIIDGDLAGPVTLTGTSDGLASVVSFMLDRSAKATRFNNIEGRLGAVEFTGSAVLQDGGELQADIDADARTFTFAGMSFGALSLKGSGGRTSGDPFAVGATFEARDIDIAKRLAIDAVTGTITTTDTGYRFEGRLLDHQTGAGSDVAFSGMIFFAPGPPNGSLSLTGTLLGKNISTREDIAWSLGPTPTIDADVAMFGGRLQARLHPGNETTSSSVTLRDLSIGPLLSAFGYPAIDAAISGTATGRLFGDNPEGVINLSAESAVDGVNSALDFGLDGRLGPRSLTVTAQSRYGADLKANAAARLPVATSSTGFVRLDRGRNMEALIEVNGELDALRLIALAYGHDLGGRLQNRTEISGTLDKPAIKSAATISDGVYEYGATGLSLKEIEVNAVYDRKILTVAGSGVGTQGGTLKANGRLAETEAGVNVTFDRLLVYDRLGDQARLSGDAKLTEEDTDRVLSGALTIDAARFNIDNFSNSSIRTLNVRWTTDDPDAAGNRLLEKPVRLELKVTAQRGVLVRGRGLDSDWGVNLDVTGRPDSLLLNGRATLVRGELELAKRPFEFESGTITFDGPLDTANMAISATRDVDSFSVRADVSGAPAHPMIELSSTPSLPQDEILSRMLFGRSSVDLSALEAAELATSIARLSGRDTGIDPIGAIQTGLGVDRLRVGVNGSGRAELGVGQYLAPDVYLEVTTQGAAGNSVEVEWQPRPQVSVASETSSTGESRVSVRWKKDY